MRMWNVNPELLCRQHLLGCHTEMHMFIGCMKKGTSLKGYIEKGLVEVQHIKREHDRIAEEMVKRGYRHLTPLEQNICYDAGYVNSEQNINELRNRCEKCKQRIERRIEKNECFN